MDSGTEKKRLWAPHAGRPASIYVTFLSLPSHLPTPLLTTFYHTTPHHRHPLPPPPTPPYPLLLPPLPHTHHTLPPPPLLPSPHAFTTHTRTFSPTPLPQHCTMQPYISSSSPFSVFPPSPLYPLLCPSCSPSQSLLLLYLVLYTEQCVLAFMLWAGTVWTFIWDMHCWKKKKAGGWDIV